MSRIARKPDTDQPDLPEVNDFELFVAEVIENTKRWGRSYNKVTYPDAPITEIEVPNQANWVIQIEPGERNTNPN